jgi:hypothetical protein
VGLKSKPRSVGHARARDVPPRHFSANAFTRPSPHARFLDSSTEDSHVERGDHVPRRNACRTVAGQAPRRKARVPRGCNREWPSGATSLVAPRAPFRATHVDYRFLSAACLPATRRWPYSRAGALRAAGAPPSARGIESKVHGTMLWCGRGARLLGLRWSRTLP